MGQEVGSNLPRRRSTTTQQWQDPLLVTSVHHIFLLNRVLEVDSPKIEAAMLGRALNFNDGMLPQEDLYDAFAVNGDSDESSGTSTEL